MGSQTFSKQIWYPESLYKISAFYIQWCGHDSDLIRSAVHRVLHAQKSTVPEAFPQCNMN